MFAQPNISYFPLDRVYTLISPNLIEKAGLEKKREYVWGQRPYCVLCLQSLAVRSNSRLKA
jgi:hypothetical protein